jgi:hypothetical protein
MTTPKATGTSTENVTDFLRDLSALTVTYGLVIAGCGCCASPWINPVTHEDTAPAAANRLTFNHETQQYETE